MDLDTLNTISNTILAEGREIVGIWLGVVSSGHKGIVVRTLGLHGEKALARALRFMLYMCFISVLIQVPAASLIGVEYQNKYYELISVLDQFIGYLACGLSFHLAMKWLGGKGALRNSFVVTCLLTAYSPLVDVFISPLRKYTFPVLKQTPNVGEAAVTISQAAQRWTAWDWSVFLASFVAITVVFVLFFLALFRSFRPLHHLSLFRAGVAFAIGLVMFVFFIAAFLTPFDDMVLKAFSRA